MDADLVIVIVTYNSAHVVDSLLASIPSALGTLKAHVVLVDNGSTDGTLDLLRRRDVYTLVSASNRGYAAGINRGVRELGGRGPILVLNPDVRLSPGSIAPLLSALDIPGTGIVAPRVINSDGSLAPSLRREPTLLRALGLGRTDRSKLSEYVTDPSAYDAQHPVDWALGAALLVSRECHERLGGWDESYFLYSEETDLCLRARDLGFATRYTPNSVVTHIGGASGTSNRIHSMQIVNRVRLYGRRHAALPTALYLAASVASEISWLIRGHRQSATAIAALVWPSRRPVELGCSKGLLPR